MQCPETKANGEPCTNSCQHGKPFCAPHNPAMKATRARMRAERNLNYRSVTLEWVDRQIASLTVQLKALHKRRISLLGSDGSKNEASR